jgi:HEAT repeat protein
MPSRIRFRTLAVVLALYACGYALAVAQPEAASRPQTAPPETASPPASPSAEVPEESPLLVEPKTPAEFFDAAVLTDRLYRPALAKRYLQKLLQLNPSDDVLIELRNKYGPGVFLRLADEAALKPASTQLLERVTAALRKHEDDPAFLDSLIAGLQGAPDERDTAVQMLTNIGPTAVPRMLKHLSALKSGEDPGVLVQALAQMGPQVLPVLVGALESTNDAIRNGAIQALGVLGSKRAIPYLLEPAFDVNQPAGIRLAARTALARIMDVPIDKGEGVSSFGAESQLKKLARDGLAGRMVWPTTNGKTDLWTWNDESKSIVRHRLSPLAASVYTGLRFSQQAMALDPEDRAAQILFLALDFAWDAQAAKEARGGQAAVPRPLGPGSTHNLALTAGPDVASSTLALGQALNNPVVELGALHALAAVGARAEIYGSHQSRSPLLAALDDPNQEVQYAAAVAILRSNPEMPFRGSQRVVEVLTRAISGTQTPFAVVIDTNREEGNQMAGLLNQIGFETIAMATGREGFEVAVRQSNVVLVAVQTNVIRWPLSQTVANLRADARSAQIPILVFGPEAVRYQIRALLSHYSPIEFMVESATPQNIEVQVGDYLKRAMALAAPPVNRVERVADATAWLASIAKANQTKIFSLDSAESALMLVSTDRALFENALAALSAIPTGTVQHHFAQLAVGERLDPAIREAAARCLVAHIEHHGLLLSSTDVSQLEIAWRAASSPQLQTALAAVVGSLKPNAKRVSSRFRELPAASGQTP